MAKISKTKLQTFLYHYPQAEVVFASDLIGRPRKKPRGCGGILCWQ